MRMNKYCVRIMAIDIIATILKSKMYKIKATAITSLVGVGRRLRNPNTNIQV